jgi:hypothetical protein
VAIYGCWRTLFPSSGSRTRRTSSSECSLYRTSVLLFIGIMHGTYWKLALRAIVLFPCYGLYLETEEHLKHVHFRREGSRAALSNAAPAIYFSGALRKHIIWADY